jgi:hypothetical protein
MRDGSTQAYENRQNKMWEKMSSWGTAHPCRIRRQIQATGAASVEEALLHLIETQEEQDRWLLETKSAVNAKIRGGIDQLDRGEDIPEDRLDAYLGELKAQPE